VEEEEGFRDGLRGGGGGGCVGAGAGFDWDRRLVRARRIWSKDSCWFKTDCSKLAKRWLLSMFAGWGEGTGCEGGNGVEGTAGEGLCVTSDGESGSDGALSKSSLLSVSGALNEMVGKGFGR
jgi:hypothetical protein